MVNMRRRRFNNKSPCHFIPDFPLLAFKVGDERMSYDEFAAFLLKVASRPLLSSTTFYLSHRILCSLCF